MTFFLISLLDTISLQTAFHFLASLAGIIQNTRRGSHRMHLKLQWKKRDIFDREPRSDRGLKIWVFVVVVVDHRGRLTISKLL